MNFRPVTLDTALKKEGKEGEEEKEKREKKKKASARHSCIGL